MATHPHTTLSPAKIMHWHSAYICNSTYKICHTKLRQLVNYVMFLFTVTSGSGSNCKYIGEGTFITLSMSGAMDRDSNEIKAQLQEHAELIKSLEAKVGEGQVSDSPIYCISTHSFTPEETVVLFLQEF